MNLCNYPFSSGSFLELDLQLPMDNFASCVHVINQCDGFRENGCDVVLSAKRSTENESELNNFLNDSLKKMLAQHEQIRRNNRLWGRRGVAPRLFGNG